MIKNEWDYDIKWQFYFIKVKNKFKKNNFWLAWMCGW
jgi:hypothetical protein